MTVTQIGPYPVGQVIEKYESASVYAARLDDGQPALLTAVEPTSEESARRIYARLDIIRNLQHPGILPLVDDGQSDDATFYMVFQYLPPMLPPNGSLPVDTVLSMSAQVSAALDFAHEHGLVHDHLDRAHIVHGANGRVYLRGFELASDEHWPDPAHPAEDISALARIMYQALTGRQSNENDFRDMPRAVASVLRHGIRGGFASAGAFHIAFEKAINSLPIWDADPEAYTAISAAAPARENMPREIRPIETDALEIRPMERLSVPRQRGTVRLGVLTVGLSILIGGALSVFLLLSGFGRNQSTADTPTEILAVATTAFPITVPPTSEVTITSFPTNTAIPTQSPTATLVPATATPLPSATPTETQKSTTTSTPAATDIATQNVALSTAPSTVEAANPATEIATIAATSAATAIADAFVFANSNVAMRSGPNTNFLPLAALKPGTPLSVLARTKDKSWIQVRTEESVGWVSSALLTVNINLDSVAVVTADEIAKMPVTNNCVNVVGDSIAHGDAIFEFPDTGYAFVQMQPFAPYIDRSFTAAGLPDAKVLDRSVSGTGISFASRSLYIQTKQYKSMLTDRCKFTIVLPWVGDLSNSSNPAQNAFTHAAALSNFVKELIRRNPYGRILIVNYYPGAPTDFVVDSFAKGFTQAGITSFNEAIANVCSGDLAKVENVTCVNSITAFSGMSISYVVGSMTRTEFESSITAPLDKNELDWLNAYTTAKPAGLLIGDGLHLSAAGKEALAKYLVQIMQSLPEMRMQITPDGTAEPTTAP